MTHTPQQRSDTQGTVEHELHAIHLPSPTAWPLVLALGFTLLIAALVLSPGIAALGGVLIVVAAAGWFHEVLPHERHEDVVVESEIVAIEPAAHPVSRIRVDETHRAQLPLQTFPISSGIKGGIAGGIAMVIPAELYGIVRFHSIWYVVNLLGGAGVANWANPTTQQLTHFRMSAFITANIIQGATTLLVGLLYGALLPVWPRRPMILGGIVAPVLWTGLLYTVLGIVNPFLQQRIDWASFAASQVIFGVVAGYTVSRLGNLRRLEQVPLPIRLGVEAPGLDGEQRRGAQAMNRVACLAWVPLLAAAGCRMPGHPPDGPEVPRPDQVLSFSQLYAENCAGCHGVHGDHGAATDLANGQYEALIDDASLRDVIANGEKGTLMPAFSVESGGDLTEAQIDALVRGIRSSWSKPGVRGGMTPPSWRGQHAGDTGKGQAVYVAACARCHGSTAREPGQAIGSILDGSFLALVNEQMIRTTVIAGRPDIGQPDWRNVLPGRALTDDEITNVTAWLLAQTPARPGHPYPNLQPTSERPGEQQPLAVKKP